MDRKERLQNFVNWFKENITGDEKGEGQIFFDRLFQAFGNPGVKEVGAVCEERVKKRKGSTGFADLVWRPRVIIELKKRNEPLHKHYEQAFEYWLTLVPDRPDYMILCNFDEFWIYDLNTQLNDPVHKLRTENLADDWGALAFLFPKPETPVFSDNSVEVTEKAAKIIGSMFLSLTKRDIAPGIAQKFVLQIVVALFAEDVGLIPKYTLHKILQEAVKNPVTQKELTDLFEAMSNESASKKPKKFQNIDYFNGGLFNSVQAIELSFEELDLLADASKENWSKVRPSIFGAIFESSMDQDSRHGHGIHYTSELDIQKIVGPTIVRPFRERIRKAKTKKEKAKILEEIRAFRVLDPSCGSGNFLYIAFRELCRLEFELMEMIDKKFDKSQLRFGTISPKNFYGIDSNKFGLELAKVSLSIGRKLAADEFNIHEKVVPFENLDDNFIGKDALFIDWPKVDAIIGNPPFQSKNKMLSEFGQAYVNKVRDAYPDISGYADYCVYWFKKSHNHIKNGGRIGLVGTNTIRQNQSRESGLDYIVNNSGTITEAVSTQVWSGDAVVHVSIVNWIKGALEGKKKLFIQNGDNLDSPWEVFDLDVINSALSKEVDLSNVKALDKNKKPNKCFPGQQHGHIGFLLEKDLAKKMLAEDKKYKDVLLPFLIGDELLSDPLRQPKRYVIDFSDMDITVASSYKSPFDIVKNEVLPWREQKAKEEKKKNNKILKENPDARVDKQYQSAFNHWWHLRRKNLKLVKELQDLNRYICCSAVTKRPIFDFVSTKIRPNASLIVFTFNDYYSFGILQSSLHWMWFTNRCSTMKGDFRYTSKTVFDSFPWPFNPTLDQIKKVAEASKKLRQKREEYLDSGQSLRDIYKVLELPGESELKTLTKKLDDAVSEAYGIKKAADPLEFLKSLNESYFESGDYPAPGLPSRVKDVSSYISDACVNLT